MRLSTKFQTLQDLQALTSIGDIPFWGMPIDQELAIYLANLVFEVKPNVVLEIGSGVSTILIGACLRHLGKGKLVSFDHDLIYFQKTGEQLEQFGLTEWVDLQLRPLTSIQIADQSWKWYDLNGCTFDQPIEILFVDGPPTLTQEYCRYPAIPLLAQWFTEEAVVILDDGQRFAEQEAARRWAMTYGLQFDYLPNEKKTIVLRKTYHHPWKAVKLAKIQRINKYRNTILSLKKIARRTLNTMSIQQ